MPNDLVIKLRSSDETGPGVNSARQGMTKLAETAEVMAQKVQRSWKPSGASFGDLRGAAQAAARRMVDESARTGSADDVEIMNRRMQLYERSASVYERSVGTKLQALARLSIAEEDAYEQSSILINRKITTEEKLMSRSVSNRTQVSRQGQMAVQQALFGIDDAITGSFNGGLRGALLGAGNNATMLAMQLGGVKAQIYTIGAVAAAQIGVRLYGYLTDTTGQAKKLEDHLERVRTLQSKIFDDASKRSARPTDFEGADTKSLKKSREDSLITLHDAEAELEKLDQANLRLKDQQKAYQADKKFLEERTLRQKADDYLNQTFPLAAENSLNKDAHARLNRLNSIDPQLEEKLKDTNKAIEKGGQRERELREQIELERENVRNAEDEGFRAEERENKEKLQKKEELMQKEARLAERKQKLLDKQARDLKNHSQKIEDFRLKAFGGQGAEESVLAKLASDIQEARELLKGGELQQAEAQLTRSAEEKLAKLSISQRPEFRETKNPALALADSDRARQIVLGAGNQMLDARTRIDKHHSAMEQLTAEVASGIKEMVAEAKRDIEVFLVED